MTKNEKQIAAIKNGIRVQERTLANLESMKYARDEAAIQLSKDILLKLQGRLSRLEQHVVNTSEMTYSERYRDTTGWTARHVAKDLMDMNGADEFITEHDDERIRDAETRDADPSGMRQLIKSVNSIMGL